MSIKDIENMETFDISDSYVCDYLDDVLSKFEKVYSSFDTHAMSDHALLLQGHKEMLGAVIKFMKKTKPWN